MPLQQSGSCEAFWSNKKHLKEKFASEGDGAKAEKRAIAAAARICRENGGSPEKCLEGKD